MLCFLYLALAVQLVQHVYRYNYKYTYAVTPNMMTVNLCVIVIVAPILKVKLWEK